MTISLPPAQLRVAERLAQKQNRTMSELFREGLRRLEQEDEQRSSQALGDLRTVIRAIQQEARRAGLDKMSRREINAEVEAARKEKSAKAKRAAKRRGR